MEPSKLTMFFGVVLGVVLLTLSIAFISAPMWMAGYAMAVGAAGYPLYTVGAFVWFAVANKLVMEWWIALGDDDDEEVS